MTANYTDTGIDLEIHDTATLTSLIWLRERVQSHIDSMTPMLATTQQSGPVQVVEDEHPHDDLLREIEEDGREYAAQQGRGEA